MLSAKQAARMWARAWRRDKRALAARDADPSNEALRLRREATWEATWVARDRWLDVILRQRQRRR